jgi:hypothetical protein
MFSHAYGDFWSGFKIRGAVERVLSGGSGVFGFVDEVYSINVKSLNSSE